MTAQILIADDEAAIRRLVRGAVERAGLTADEAATAAEALTAARRPGCELVLLDLGADDYVVKPFDTEELLARVRGALRRHNARPVGQDRLTAGPIEIDLGAHLVWRDGQTVKLTRKEFALLAELARHAGKLLTHAHLLRVVWGEGHLDDVEYLRVAVRALRLKLEADPAAPALVMNEPGIGYRLAV